MKKSFLFVCLIIGLTAFAQKDLAKYKERAQEVRQDVWENAVTEFKATSIPSEYSNESAVVIARSYDVVNSSKVKLKLSILGFGAARRNLYRTTIHERVKIQDKSALEEYSTIEYQKKLDKTTTFAWTKVYNKMETYIGAKIIKPDGKEIVVNTDEEVLTKDEEKAKKGKLAVSDLQIGDILDYYINIEEMRETEAEPQGPFTFLMGGEYPILFYSVRFQVDEKAGVKYIAANGAPTFKESRTEDDDIVLELKQKNLPKIQSTMWTSLPRQLPYLALQYKLVSNYEGPNSLYQKGRVQKEQIADKLISQYRDLIGYMAVDYSVQENVKKHFGGKKKIKEASPDSVAKMMYEYWRYQTFCRFATDKIEMNNTINYREANSLSAALNMSRWLQGIIDHDVVLVCSRNSNSLKNVLTLADMDAMIRVQSGGKTYWMAFDDITTRFNEIPARFQGEEAVTIEVVGGNKMWQANQQNIKVPVSAAADNHVAEDISVTFAPDNLQQLKIDRSCVLSGTYHSGEQKRLLLMEDIEKTLAKALGQKSFLETLSEEKKTQKLVPEFSAAFGKEKSDWKKYFKAELNDQFEEEPKEVLAYEIKSEGLLHTGENFSYRTSFSMDNFVKKAGNNYILDAGKLIGKYRKVEDKDRNRKLDVYMYSARTFSYNINIAIPEGYTVKGAEELNKKLANETGTFTSEATVEGNVLKIVVNRTFVNNFEKAAAFPKLLELQDAVYEFNSKKVLLEKKK